MTIELALLFAGVSCLCAYLGYWKGQKKDSTQQGQQQGKLETDITYIKTGIDDIKKTVENHDIKIWDLARQMAETQASTKSAHHRIDQFEKGD